MKIAAVVLATALCVGWGSAAFAGGPRCAPVAAQNWMPIEKAVARAQSLGYMVRKTKRSKGCWKIEGYDRNGAKVEFRLDPASGEVVKPRDWHEFPKQ